MRGIFEDGRWALNVGGSAIGFTKREIDAAKDISRDHSIYIAASKRIAGLWKGQS